MPSLQRSGLIFFGKSPSRWCPNTFCAAAVYTPCSFSDLTYWQSITKNITDKPCFYINRISAGFELRKSTRFNQGAIEGPSFYSPSLVLLLSIQHRSNPTIMDYKHVTIASSKIAMACKSSRRIIDSQTFRGRR